MNLIINSSNSFEIVDGLIKSNKNFDVEKKENSLIISSGNNISIDGNTINIQSTSSIKINGNEIYINGIKVDDSAKKSDKECEFSEYKLNKEEIESININSSGKLNIIDSSILNYDNLNINLQGSGKITTGINGVFISYLNINLKGSGKINLNKFQSDFCNCSLQGSGNISLKDSNFNKLNLNIQGSGDILGNNSTYNKITKNISGSGDIDGFINMNESELKNDMER